MRNLLKDFTLLYAEDESNVQASMMEYLKTYFKEIHLASDGQEALDLYKKIQPDVLILDINMPKISGLDVAKRIREKDEDVRILMLTAHTEKDLLLEAVEIEMTRYLVKPVKPSEFKKALDKTAEELVSKSKKLIKFSNGLCWYIKEEVLKENNLAIYLTPKEKKLMSLLASKRGTCVSSEDIMANVWEDNFYDEISKDSVKMQVNYLRKKIPKGAIENIYGKGYCLKR